MTCRRKGLSRRVVFSPYSIYFNSNISGLGESGKYDSPRPTNLCLSVTLLHGVNNIYHYSTYYINDAIILWRCTRTCSVYDKSAHVHNVAFHYY